MEAKTAEQAMGLLMSVSDNCSNMNDKAKTNSSMTRNKAWSIFMDAVTDHIINKDSDPIHPQVARNLWEEFGDYDFV